MKKVYECNPIETISSTKTSSATVFLNLNELVDMIENVLSRKEFVYILVSKEAFKRYINEVLSSYENSNWNAFKLPVTIPDISGDGIYFETAYTEQQAPTPAPVP